jgi:hypothetical protein
MRRSYCVVCSCGREPLETPLETDIGSHFYCPGSRNGSVFDGVRAKCDHDCLVPVLSPVNVIQRVCIELHGYVLLPFRHVHSLYRDLLRSKDASCTPAPVVSPNRAAFVMIALLLRAVGDEMPRSLQAVGEIQHTREAVGSLSIHQEEELVAAFLTGDDCVPLNSIHGPNRSVDVVGYPRNFKEVMDATILRLSKASCHQLLVEELKSILEGYAFFKPCRNVSRFGMKPVWNMKIHIVYKRPSIYYSLPHG